MRLGSASTSVRCLAPADVDRERAAVDEPAAGCGVDGGRRGALADLDRLERALAVRHGRDQETGVRMQRVREHLVDRCSCSSLPGEGNAERRT